MLCVYIYKNGIGLVEGKRNRNEKERRESWLGKGEEGDKDRDR